MSTWDSGTIDYDMRNDDDYPDPSDDEFNEFEDERAALRGTSQCDGLCDPQCDWCLVSHHCPTDCAGNECPYDALTKECSTCEGLGHNGWEACADCHGTGSFPP
jgi:hypothetical protein